MMRKRVLAASVVLAALAVLAVRSTVAARGRAPEPRETVIDLVDEQVAMRMDVKGATVEHERSGGRGRLEFTLRSGSGTIDFTTSSGFDLSRFKRLVFTVRGDAGGQVEASVEERTNQGKPPSASGRPTALTAADGELVVGLPTRVFAFGERELFGMRGYPAEARWRSNMAHVWRMRIRFSGAAKGKQIVVSGVAGVPRDVKVEQVAFFPFIDAFGQYMHRDWPGKVTSLADLRGRVDAEDRDLARHAGPADWNEWGGWKTGPKLEATGHFRVAKHAGKWWLVDPDGRLFFSHGIDCVGYGNHTPIDDRDGWFAQLPPREGETARFFGRQHHVVRDYYQGKHPRCVNFIAWNLMRKYGDDWGATVAARAHRRLRSWGMNTIGNWSHGGIYGMKRTPYVVPLHVSTPTIEASEGYWGKFPDVYDQRFRERIAAALESHAKRTADDPWNIGYFSGNELSWGDERSLGLAVLSSPAAQPAKQAFVERLKQWFDSIDDLNKAWSTQHKSWDDLLASTTPPEAKRADAQLHSFYKLMADRFFRTWRDEIRRVAPDKLYLGCRFAWVNPTAAASAAEYCDVVSTNRYQRDVSAYRYPDADADVPILIGEFHFGARDRGMFHPGLVSVDNQAARAKAYRDYVTGALRHAQIVGCHWFQYYDQPPTGRGLDGENYQIGFLDGCDTPYPETIAASRAVGYRLYQIRSQTDREDNEE